MGTDKKRLSKRNAATSLEEYKEKGYLDTAILNTLARLGWSQGDKEVFYLDDLIKEFKIEEVQKAGAIFDITKLDWLNSQHLSNLTLEDFKNKLSPFLTKAYFIKKYPIKTPIIAWAGTAENDLKIAKDIEVVSK